MPLRYVLRQMARRNELLDSLYVFLTDFNSRPIEVIALFFAGLRGLLAVMGGSMEGLYSILAILHSVAFVLCLPRYSPRWKRCLMSLKVRYCCCTVWAAAAGLSSLYLLVTQPLAPFWTFHGLISMLFWTCLFKIQRDLLEEKKLRDAAEASGVTYAIAKQVDREIQIQEVSRRIQVS